MDSWWIRWKDWICKHPYIKSSIPKYDMGQWETSTFWPPSDFCVFYAAHANRGLFYARSCNLANLTYSEPIRMLGFPFQPIISTANQITANPLTENVKSCFAFAKQVTRPFCQTTQDKLSEFWSNRMSQNPISTNESRALFGPSRLFSNSLHFMHLRPDFLQAHAT